MGRRSKEFNLPETDEIPVGSIIRARRLYLGFALKVFCELMGNYNVPYVSRIENNKVTPSEHFVELAAKNLQLLTKDELTGASRSQVFEWIEISRRRKQNKKQGSIALQVSPQLELSQLVIEDLESEGDKSDLLRALEWHSRRITAITDKLLKEEK